MFIKLHRAVDNELMYFNVDNINIVTTARGTPIIHTGSETDTFVKESPEEVVKLIHSAQAEYRR